VGRRDARRNQRSGGREAEKGGGEGKRRSETESRSEQQQQQWRQWGKRTHNGQPVVNRVRFQVEGGEGAIWLTVYGRVVVVKIDD
jgi:hypothetical protein